MGEVSIRYVGGPTAVVEICGLRLVTDPTFDAPGDYPVGPDRKLVKTAGPAVEADETGAVDAVLLSHDQHPDNLDESGRAYLARVPLVLSTPAAHGRLGDVVTALPNWETYELGERLRITGVPALHGPEGAEALTGEVTGFVLHGDAVPTVYVSGDNASLDHVRAVAERFGPVDVAVLFAGAARTPLFDGAPLTLTSEAAAEAAQILGARHVVPLHFEHWVHFSEGADTLTEAFAAAGLSERLRLLKPGATFTD
ncbi:MBL fold metallo-hydrolase [Streptomyces sp. TLI_146]|uniref:MBL fold metallo-hydrolase n=1 Tax=Streptomyces sp. TLI_146 TaxID=1938858 RepID=UPI000C706F32|nr:MBL fold metallo-hydrolase [Streptomyces sp. TLI_146]PKV88811.1 L-ascorbate metabolism protein UlaG (beta-lactamase superfamily) [Streptomyces sp. TLI_146]